MEGTVGSVANFTKYLMTAVGSALEMVNILHFAYGIGYVSQAQKNEMYEKAEKLIRKMRNFAKSLRSD